jgi:adenylyltransferase/sulfurtransferase
MPLTPEELRRYSRHLVLPEFGPEAQEKLKAGRVLVVGAGGLGSPAALYLAAAGVGTLGLVDFDEVDESNLQRQVIYATGDVGRPKLAAAAERLEAANPHVTIVQHGKAFGPDNASELVEAYDVVVDGTDNFTTRFLVNDACVMVGRPNVYGSIWRFEGQASVFATAGGPCYRCLHPEPPPAGLIDNCAEGGVLGVLPGVIGTIQATEAIKLLTGVGEALVGRLLLYDAQRMRFREITLPRDSRCPVCGDTPTIRELVAYDLACDPETTEGTMNEMTVEELKAWRDEGKDHVLIDVRQPAEHAVAKIEGGTLIPLGSLMGQLDSLPTDRTIVVYCRTGARSGQAVGFLRAKGFDAVNLSGGIHAWSDRIDPAVKKY